MFPECETAKSKPENIRMAFQKHSIKREVINQFVGEFRLATGGHESGNYKIKLKGRRSQ
jgi:hypothetical protein